MDQSITVAATVGKVETTPAEEVDIGHIEGEKILIGTCDFNLSMSTVALMFIRLVSVRINKCEVAHSKLS